MTDTICGATKRDDSGEFCEQPAGWGTDHVGEGRCKLHGGNAGAPANNQNASKHGLDADPYHYYQSLNQARKDEIQNTVAAILDRIQRYQDREPDKNDYKIAKRIAIEFDIVAKASAYIENESGMVQEVPIRGSTRGATTPLLEEVRRYDRSILKSLKELGVLDGPESGKVDALESWRGFIEDGRDL